MRNIIITAILLFCCLAVHAQEQHYGDYFELQNQLNSQNTYEYIASEHIKLLTQFKSKASDGNSCLLTLDSQGVYPPENGENGGSNDGKVGTLVGTIDVSQLGGMTYSIPLEIPEGINGMQPNLAITYNSQGGNGIMGWGWNISGLSAITRTGQTVYHDGHKGGITFNDFSGEDRFMLDGQRLIQHSYYPYSKYASCYYRTEMDSQTEITSTKENTSHYVKFKARTADGHEIEYGYTEDSRIEAQGKNEVLTWLVNKISDRNGNSILFYYNENNETGEYYIDSIQYTAHSTDDGFNVNPEFCIKFNYKSYHRNHSFAFVHGSLVQNNQLIESIVVKRSNSSQVLTKYSFTYDDNYYENLYYRLRSITKTQNGKSLNPTRITYKNESPYIHYSIDEVISDRFSFIGDFNGDGFSDLATVPYKTGENYNGEVSIWFFLNDRTGHFSSTPDYTLNHISFKLDWLNVVDLNGDGYDDLVAFYYDYCSTYKDTESESVIQIYLNNRDNTFGQPIEFMQPNIFAEPAIGDFSGDGIADILFFRKNSTSYGEPYFIRCENGSIIGELYLFQQHQQEWPIFIAKDLITADFDGDGKTDLLFVDTEESHLYTVEKKVDNSFRLKYLYSTCSLNCQGEEMWTHTFPGDYNGDGLADVLYTKGSSGEWNYVLSTGSSFHSQSNSGFGFGTLTDERLYGPSLRIASDNDNVSQAICVGDVDGDGKTDVVTSSFYGGTGIRCGGIGYNGHTTCQGSFESLIYFNKKYIHLGKFLGNEGLDLFGCAYGFDKENGGKYGIYSRGSRSMRNNIKCITDGVGNRTEFQYDYLMPGTDGDVFYTFENRLLQNDIQTVPIPIQAIKSQTITNTLGNSIITEYAYVNAYFHKNGHGLLGFENTKSTTKLVIGEEEKLLSEQENDFELETMGENAMLLPAESRTYVYFNGTRKLQTKTELSYKKIHSEHNDLIVNAVPMGQTVSTYDIDKPNNTLLKRELNEFEYSFGDGTTYLDSYHCTTARTGLDQSAQSFDECEYKTVKEMTYYDDNGSDWILNRIETEKTEQVKEGCAPIANYISYEYDDDYPLRVKSVLKLPNDGGITTDPLATLEEYTYDEFGHVETTTVSAPNAEENESPRKTELEYGSDYGFRLLTAKTADPDGLSHTSYFTYDDYDNIESSTDCGGLTTDYEQDALGVTQKVTMPDGIEEVSALRWSNQHDMAPTNATYYSWNCSTATAPTLEFYHKNGTVLRTVSRDMKERVVYVDQEYTDLGQVKRVSAPYAVGETHQWTEYEYDDIGRQTKVTYPDGTWQETVYDGLDVSNTLHPAAGSHYVEQSTSQSLNIAGLTETSTDANGTTVNYTYYSNGNLESSMIGSDELTKIEIEYDRGGQRETLKDPNYGTISTKYNAFGELVRMTTPKGDVTEYLYDALGRKTTMTETHSNSQSFVTSWNYDETNWIGMLESVNSDNQTISYEYDNLYRVKNITDERAGGKRFLTSYEYDDLSRLHKVTYPSGIAIIKGYNSVGACTSYSDTDGNLLWHTDEINAQGQLKQATLGNGIVTNMDYYDDTHRLKNIVSSKNVQDLHYTYDDFGNFESRNDAIHNLTEIFTYDNLNRLETITLNGSILSVMDYDQYGRIKSKQTDGHVVYDNASYNYTDQTTGLVRPHAISQANVYPNPFSGNHQEITYTAFDKVETITEGNNHLSYTYGYNHERISMSETVAGIGRTKDYADHCEFINNGSKVLTYLGGALGAFAVVVTENGTNTIHYIHKDHLGSWTTITDVNGNIEQELSFDAWGNLRDANTWSGICTQVPMFDRGFTGHEHLWDFGLINMNGRMYDPVMSSFLSVDNYVQSPENSQNFNRYAYCLNNPLKYTDPDGEFWHIIAGAVIGGAINLYQNWDNIDNFWEGLSSFSVGAGSGALTAVNPLIGSILGTASVNAHNEITKSTGLGNGLNKVNWEQVGLQSVIGAGTGLLSYGTGEIIGTSSISTKIMDLAGIGNLPARNIIGSTINGSISGAVAGLGTGLLENKQNWWQYTWRGAAFGGLGGLAYGAVTEAGYQIQLKNGRSDNLNSEITEGSANIIDNSINQFNNFDGEEIYVTLPEITIVAESATTATVYINVSPNGPFIPPAPYKYYSPTLFRLKPLSDP